MPSSPHQALIEIFRFRPELVAELLTANSVDELFT